MRTLSRVSAPFEARGGTEPNSFGGYLTLVISVAIGLFIHAPTSKKKLMFFSIAVMAFIPFLYTLSRASYIALLAAILVLGILGRKLLILGLVAAILLGSPILMPEEIKDRVNYTFQRGAGEPLIMAGQDTGLKIDKSTHERIYVWRKVSFILHVAPWFGGGISWETVLDSQYARVILETGLIGLAAFLFMQFRLLRTTREARRWSRDWLCRGLGLGMSGATIGLIVHSLGTISFLIVRIMEPFWFLMALTAVARSLAIDGHERSMRAARLARENQRADAQASTEVLEATPRPLGYPPEEQAPSRG